MKFGTVGGRAVLVDNGRALDVAAASSDALPADPIQLLERWDDLLSWAQSADWASSAPVTVEQLGPPVPAPRQVFAIGLNYAPHAFEAGFTPPEQPMVFTKFPSCITGPHATVLLPDGNVDWEIEVVAVVGRGGYRIPAEHAWDSLAGLSLGQDLSERIAQAAGPAPQFSLAKSHPGFGPFGPIVATADEFEAPDDVGFSSHIGDEVIQHGRTSELIFSISALVAFISATCPLLPGDLIFTGTPGGVGNRLRPQRFLQPGEVLISRLEVVGEICQRFARA